MLRYLKVPLVLILTLAAAVCFKSEFIKFLLGFEIMVVLAAVLEIRYLSDKIKAEVVIPERIVYQNAPFQIQAKVMNLGRLPLPEVTARLAIKDFLVAERILTKGILMLDSGESGRLCFELDSVHCGSLEVTVQQIMIRDHLGLFSKKLKVDDRPGYVYVLPVMDKDLFDRIDDRANVLDSEGDESRKGQSALNISDLRTYRPGDAIKHIHWKLSARTMELMVRQLTDPTEKESCLYLNLGRKGDALPRDEWDLFTKQAGTLSASLLEIGQSHQVIWADMISEQLVMHKVHDQESLFDMMCALLRTYTWKDRDLSGLFRENHLDETIKEGIEIRLQSLADGAGAA